MSATLRNIGNRDIGNDSANDSAGRPQPLAEVLAALGDRVAPISMAGERTLPVSDEFAELFHEGGLVRGRVLSCAGNAATTLALGLIGPAVEAGSWVAVIDVPTLGLDAACELGVPLERVVSVATGNDDRTDGYGNTEGSGEAQQWADVVAAATDGFDVLIVRVPASVRAAAARRVATRLQQRGVVMVVLGDPGAFVCDGTLEGAAQIWSGLGNGWGHLQQRSIEVSAAGRRVPGRRCRTLIFPISGERTERSSIETAAATPALSHAS